jgi:hypothetical protein
LGTRDGRELRIVTNTPPSAFNDGIDVLTVLLSLQTLENSGLSLTAVAQFDMVHYCTESFEMV